MNLKKLSGLLQLALKFQEIISEDAFEWITGQKLSDERWDLLLRHYREVEPLAQQYGFVYQRISDEYALIRIEQNQIGPLSTQDEVIYLELPRVMKYILDQSLSKICVTEKTTNPTQFGLSGKGVIVGIIDSGIDYAHPDFRKEDGRTRIVSLWDQETQGNPPRGLTQGSVYTEETINQALQAPTREERLSIVPQEDRLGHGTAIAGIAAGNGRASKGKYKGVAPEADLVIVKVSNPNSQEVLGEQLPRNVEIMLGIRFIIETAISRNQPASIVMGYGLNEGTHDGKNSMELFIDKAAVVGKTNLVVGVGNQANKDNHTAGTIKADEVKTVPIFIDEGQPYYLLLMITPVSDTVGVSLSAPTGERTEVLTGAIKSRGYVFGNTGVTINFSGPNPNTSVQQVTILLNQFEGEEVNPGIWTLQLSGENIIRGKYNIWASSIDPVRRLTRFLQPDPLMTLTIPSTAERITSVGALNQGTNQMMPFSGRGETVDERIKPDIVAPANQVTAPTSLVRDGYQNVTGTSVAAAFMTGGYALLLEYGLQKSPDQLIYGETLKAWVIRTATRLPQYAPYPNPSFGYGRLCIDAALEALKEQYNR